MLALLKKLFKPKPRGKEFKFHICNDKSEAPQQAWYHLERWKAPNFLKMEVSWSKDWKIFFAEEPVVGVTHGKREEDFILMGDRPDFRIYLERERDKSR